MTHITDLTKGPILKSLWIMAVPLISASFVQMAYNLTDMLWLGHLGSNSVAAVGAAGFFTWLCNAFSYMTKTGAEITISQSIGAGDTKRASVYAHQALMLSLFFSLLYALFIYFQSDTLIRFFDFPDSVASLAVNYMHLIVPGLFFQFNNNTFSGFYNGQGNSKTPFITIAVGLGINIILDPLLIYGYGPFPAWGTSGAAIATVSAQCIVFLLFSKKIFSNRFPLGKIRLISRLQPKTAQRIIFLGLPISLESALFSMFSLTLATLAARWGSVGVAAQSIGAQIEALSWMTAAGFSTALAAFVGQNYGAGNYRRIRQGYHLTMAIAGGIGLTAGLLFFLFNKQIFGIFVPEPVAIETGGTYLKILALSQLFMVTEMVTAGAFNGCGRTVPPALTGIVLTGARIPLAFYLSGQIGLDGIWWSITISSILKGLLLPLWYHFVQKKLNITKIKEKIL